MSDTLTEDFEELEAGEETFEEEAAEEETPRELVVKSTEALRVDLTQEEILAASREMARAVDELHDLEQERKAAAEGFKARIAQANAAVQINSNIVRNGYEFRRVEVERAYNYEAKTVTGIRLDTGEIIESRPMTFEERQMTL